MDKTPLSIQTDQGDNAHGSSQGIVHIASGTVDGAVGLANYGPVYAVNNKP